MIAHIFFYRIEKYFILYCFYFCGYECYKYLLFRRVCNKLREQDTQLDYTVYLVQLAPSQTSRPAAARNEWVLHEEDLVISPTCDVGVQFPKGPIVKGPGMVL